MGKSNWALSFAKKRIEKKGNSSGSKPKSINKNNSSKKSSSKSSKKKSSNSSKKKQTNIAVKAAKKAGITSKTSKKKNSGKSSKKTKNRKTGGHKAKKRVNSASIVCINLNNGKTNKRSTGNTKNTSTKKTSATKTEKNQKSSSASNSTKTNRSMGGKSKQKTSFLKRTAASATTFVGSIGASALNNAQTIKNLFVTDHKANNARDKWGYGGSGSARRADWDIGTTNKTKEQMAKDKAKMEKQEKKDQKEAAKYIKNQKQWGDKITESKTYKKASQNSSPWVQSAGKFVADIPLYVNPVTAGAAAYQNSLEENIRSGKSYKSASNTAAIKGIKTGAATLALEGAARPVAGLTKKVGSKLSGTKVGQKFATGAEKLTSKFRKNKPSGYRNGEPVYDVKYKDAGSRRTSATDTSGEYGLKNDLVSINKNASQGGVSSSTQVKPSGYRNGEPFYDVQYTEASGRNVSNPKLSDNNVYRRGTDGRFTNNTNSNRSVTTSNGNVGSPRLSDNNVYRRGTDGSIEKIDTTAPNGRNVSNPRLSDNNVYRRGPDGRFTNNTNSNRSVTTSNGNVGSPRLSDNNVYRRGPDGKFTNKGVNNTTDIVKVNKREITQSNGIKSPNTNEIVNVPRDFKIPTLDDVLKFKKVPNVNVTKARNIKNILKRVGIGAGVATGVGSAYLFLNEKNKMSQPNNTGAVPMLSPESLIDYLFGNYNDNNYGDLGSGSGYDIGSYSNGTSYNGNNAKGGYDSLAYKSITSINKLNNLGSYNGFGNYSNTSGYNYARQTNTPEGLGSADINDLLSMIIDFIEQHILGNRQNLIAIINDYFENGNIDSSLNIIMSGNEDLTQYVNEIMMKSLNEVAANGTEVNDAFLEALTNQVRNNYAMFTM